MSAAFITFRRNKARRVKSRVVSKKVKFGPVSLGFITVILFSLLSLFYLAQSNQISTKGYKIRDLETTKKELQAENERLQVEAARLQAVSMIQAKAKDLGMQQVSKVEYLSSFGNLASSKK